MSTENDQRVAELYVAMFGRAPDSEGLAFWSGLLQAGLTVAQVADAMFATQPARAYFPTGASNGQIIASFYLNVLGRTADAGGLAFWTAKLDAPGATPGLVISQMVDVVTHYTGSDPAGLFSAALFDNRAAAALFYGEHNGSIAQSTQVLAGVSADPATVLAARTLILGAGAGGTVDAGGFGAVAIGAFAQDVTLAHLAAGTDLVVTATSHAFDPSTVDPHPLLAYQLQDPSGANDTVNLVFQGTGPMEVGYLQLPGIENLNVIDFDPAHIGGGSRVVWLQTQEAGALASLKSLTVTGDMFTAFGDPVHVQAVDATGASGGISIASTGGSQLSTITGGPGNDVLAGWSNGTGRFVINGGAGNDVIQAGLAQDVVTGGPGADMFVPTTGFNRGDFMSITDFTPAAGDSIDLELVVVAGPGAWNPAPVSGAGTTLDAFLDAAAAATNISASGHSAVRWFLFGGNTYVVVDNSDAPTFVDGIDQFVQLVGQRDLSAAHWDPDTALLA